MDRVDERGKVDDTCAATKVEQEVVKLIEGQQLVEWGASEARAELSDVCSDVDVPIAGISCNLHSDVSSSPDNPAVAVIDSTTTSPPSQPSPPLLLPPCCAPTSATVADVGGNSSSVIGWRSDAMVTMTSGLAGGRKSASRAVLRREVLAEAAAGEAGDKLAGARAIVPFVGVVGSTVAAAVEMSRGEEGGETLMEMETAKRAAAADVARWVSEGGEWGPVSHAMVNAIGVMQAAMESGDATRVAALLAVTMLYETGCTILHHAAMRGAVDVVEALVAAGADLSCRASQCLSIPLHFAAACNHLAVVVVLLAAGSPVDSWDETARTPLHEAAQKGYGECVKALVAAGALIKIRDEFGSTPESLATENGHHEVARMLREAAEMRGEKDDDSLGSILPSLRSNGELGFIPFGALRPAHELGVSPSPSPRSSRWTTSVEGMRPPPAPP